MYNSVDLAYTMLHNEEAGAGSAAVNYDDLRGVVVAQLVPREKVGLLFN